ncbi:hypothetical protein BDR04DRAFT_1140073 [Suillus decipiens]|nr:hypothetical protein BDR04DRAFT_1140073 [Suillus decipiens]
MLQLGRVLWSLNALIVSQARQCGSYFILVTMEMDEAALHYLPISHLRLLVIGDAWQAQPSMLIIFVHDTRSDIEFHDVNSDTGTVIMMFIDKDPQGIFLARACAIWEFRKRMMAIFMISGVLYTIAGHVVLSISGSEPKITKSPIRITSCLETGGGSTIIIAYAITAAAEIQIWIFVLYKAIASYWREGTHNRLLGRLVLHNTIYMTCGLRELLPH